MSHYDVFFAFGKMGTYLLSHPEGTVKRNIPADLENSFNKRGLQKVFWLAMDSNDNYICYYQKPDGGTNAAWSRGFDKVYPQHCGHWKQSGRWILDGIAFGPKIGYHLSWGPRCKWACWATKTTFESMAPSLYEHQVRNAAFGRGEAFVIIFASGHVSYQGLETSYPDLYTLLCGQQYGNILFVALNQYRDNEYFVVLANAEVHIRASAIVERDVAKVLEKYPKMDVISSTMARRNANGNNTASADAAAAATLAELPTHRRRTHFLNGISNGVAAGAATAAMTAVFASCSVM